MSHVKWVKITLWEKYNVVQQTDPRCPFMKNAVMTQLKKETALEMDKWTLNKTVIRFCTYLLFLIWVKITKNIQYAYGWSICALHNKCAIHNWYIFYYMTRHVPPKSSHFILPFYQQPSICYLDDFHSQESWADKQKNVCFSMK